MHMNISCTLYIQIKRNDSYYVHIMFLAENKFWRIQEISSIIGTETLNVYQKMSEILGLVKGYNHHMILIQSCSLEINFHKMVPYTHTQPGHFCHRQFRCVYVPMVHEGLSPKEHWTWTRVLENLIERSLKELKKEFERELNRKSSPESLRDSSLREGAQEKT